MYRKLSDLNDITHSNRKWNISLSEEYSSYHRDSTKAFVVDSEFLKTKIDTSSDEKKKK